MTDPTPAGSLTLLDACVVINLYATRRMEEIPRATPAAFGVVDAVRREAMHVRGEGSAAEADARKAVELDALFAAGALLAVSPTEEELAASVELTVQLDDGEAMTLAVAFSRGAIVATDAKKAIRVIGDRSRVASSLHLIKAWADARGLEASGLGPVLGNVREGGRCVPGSQHPHKGWWDAAISGT